jgi:hypothetical protein
MYKLNPTSTDQGRTVSERISREFDCVTDSGVSFQVRITEDSNTGNEYYTNLNEDQSGVDEWHRIEDDSDLYSFIEEGCDNGLFD